LPPRRTPCCSRTCSSSTITTRAPSSSARCAFLVRSGERTAGFILARRGSPVVTDPEVLDVAEFFVLRGFRNGGVGRKAAHLLWDRLPGTWIVRASNRNADAVRFWRGVVSAYTRGTAREYEHASESNPWTVFSFEAQSSP
jgi:predicted acetyltransferase